MGRIINIVKLQYLLLCNDFLHFLKVFTVGNFVFNIYFYILTYAYIKFNNIWKVFRIFMHVKKP